MQKSAQANALMQAGKPEAALPIYRELVATFPAEPSFRVNLVIAQYKTGLYREAAAECRILLQRQPALFPALLFLGASHLSLGEASSAIQPLRRALAINPADPNARLMLADALFEHQEWKDAAEQYSKASQMMPDGPRVWYGLHRSYAALAAEYRARLEKEAPGSAEALAFSGSFEAERLQFARAFQLYRSALARQPAFRGLHGHVAEVYEWTGHPDWAAAELALERASVCDSQSPECDFAAGRIEKAALADASTPSALYWQGLATQVLSQRAYARLQTLPPSRERYEAAAELAERSARHREAAAAWKEALALAPADNGLRRRLALALCYSNDCGSALPLLKSLVAGAPASAEFNYLCGLALNSVGEPGSALPFLEAAVQLDGNLTPARGALGEALLETGIPERAIPHLEAGLAVDEKGVRRYQLARALRAAGKQQQSLAMMRQYRAIVARRAAEEKNEPRITPP
jgi:predicted Zn-dependent protease